MGNHYLLKMTSQISLHRGSFGGSSVILSDRVLVQSRISRRTPADMICTLKGVENKSMLFN